MRKLHLVGLTTDRDGLIFTARKGSKSGGYIVPLDKKVLAAIAAASRAGERRAGGGACRRRRGGGRSQATAQRERPHTPGDAGAPAGRAHHRRGGGRGRRRHTSGWPASPCPSSPSRPRWWSWPGALVYAKPRLGDSSEPLGSSVLQNLSDRGVFMPDDVAHAAWSAFQLHDSVWMVRFRYRSRGRDQEAQWEIDVPTGRLRARNRQASDLGYVGPDRWQAAEELEDQPPEDGGAPAGPGRPPAGRWRPSPARSSGRRPRPARPLAGQPRPCATSRGQDHAGRGAGGEGGAGDQESRRRHAGDEGYRRP